MPLARHAKAAPVPTVQEPLTVQFLAVIEEHSTELESSPGELDFSFPVSQGLVAALPGEFPECVIRHSFPHSSIHQKKTCV